jgi:mycothiol synthase
MTITLPDALDWRPLSPELIETWHPLRAALALTEGAPEFPSADDLRDELAASWLDLPQDSLIGLDSSGVARAYAVVEVRPAEGSLVRAWCQGGVHPSLRGRGIGRALLAWQCDRAEHLVSRRRTELGIHAPATIMIEVPRGGSATAALLTRAGFSAARTTLMMRRVLSRPVEPVPEPAGLRIVPFDPAFDEQLRLAHNAAFAEHAAFQPWSPAVWQQWSTGHRGFRPDWTFLALDGEQIAGYVLSAAFPDEWPLLGFTQGYVAKLGTRPAWRSRGIARALLSRTVAAMAADGLEYAGLDVDAGNSSGALNLYAGLGFEAWDSTVLWEHQV